MKFGMQKYQLSSWPNSQKMASTLRTCSPRLNGKKLETGLLANGSGGNLRERLERVISDQFLGTNNLSRLAAMKLDMTTIPTKPMDNN